MKASELRELSTSELTERQREFKAELFNLRFQHATGQLSNPMVLRDCKKNIARVMTILRARQLKAQ